MFSEGARRRRERFDRVLGCSHAELASLDVERLGVLVRDLKAHLAAVADDLDPAVADELRSIWAELEYLYATGLAEGRTAVTASERRLVRAALAGLQALAADRLNVPVAAAERR